ncbi:hypothetical protein HPP92_002278 [Vanilla planifolia]|uniref:RRM domain-containing protein n=1 Tax=Vanilla planifolia TaxID=51239 RepID=A0A835VG51_VANPL|nr:hypothetical protein HPP92_002278 [Vanilla planifolia]
MPIRRYQVQWKIIPCKGESKLTSWNNVRMPKKKFVILLDDPEFTQTLIDHLLGMIFPSVSFELSYTNGGEIMADSEVLTLGRVMDNPPNSDVLKSIAKSAMPVVPVGYKCKFMELSFDLRRKDIKLARKKVVKICCDSYDDITGVEESLLIANQFFKDLYASTYEIWKERDNFSSSPLLVGLRELLPQGREIEMLACPSSQIKERSNILNQLIELPYCNVDPLLRASVVIELKQWKQPILKIKSLRLPMKLGGHRGFAFVEYVTKQEAQNALQALSSTHLYGRHLVLERAKAGESLEELRARTAAQFVDEHNRFRKLSNKRKNFNILDEATVKFARIVE